MSQTNAPWPLPKFYFRVKFNDVEANFAEITGLNVNTQEIEYRRPNTAEFAVTKLTGLKKFGNMTLKKGIFLNDNTFFEWHTKIKRNAMSGERITIDLLDQSDSVLMSWTLHNAIPTKIQGADLNSAGNEVAVETIEISHEGLELTKQ